MGQPAPPLDLASGAGPVDPDAVPAWVNGPSAFFDIPGDPVPGYEKPRFLYTQEDKDAMAKALDKRNDDNHANVGDFLGAYAGA